MNLFELAWTWHEVYMTWHEVYIPYLFVHETKTREEFEADVRDAYRKYGDEYLQSEEDFVRASGWTYFVASKLPDYGYVPIKPIAVSCFAARLIDNDYDDRNFAEKFIGDELLKKAVEHNSVLLRLESKQ